MRAKQCIVAQDEGTTTHKILFRSVHRHEHFTFVELSRRAKVCKLVDESVVTTKQSQRSADDEIRANVQLTGPHG